MRSPAYARRILDRRRAGDHPKGITLVLGDDWTPPEAPWPEMIALKPEDWRPGAINWLVCTGLPILIEDRTQPPYSVPARRGVVRATSAGDWCPWLALAVGGEISEVAARVMLQDDQTDMIIAARCYRYPRNGRFHWPAWWSDAREARARRNSDRWLDEMQAWIGSPVERCA